jgi:radical SAM superfamily enzyme YgiQ (UPF0313 family)
MPPSTQKYNIILFSDYSSELFMPKMLGPYKVANRLRQSGFDVQVIDHLHVFSVEEIKKILKKVVNKHTLFVGVNSFLYSNIENIQSAGNEKYQQGGIKFSPKQRGSIIPYGIKYNREIIDLIKHINPSCKIVLGGPDAQDHQHYKDYDYIVYGYGDLSVINLARHLAHGEDLKKARRTVWGPTIIEDSKAEGYDFSSDPMIYHDNDIILPGETLFIEIARGCIFKCKFCSYPLNGKTKNDFIKLEEVLYQEFMDNYNRFKVTRYQFSDDTFNDSPEKLQMMYNISKRLPFELEYWAYIRLDLLAAHPETINLLFESGCRSCYFGIETFHEKTARLIGKSGNRTRLINTIKYIKATYGEKVSLSGNFIFGLPHEPIESLEKTAEQLLSNNTGLDSWRTLTLMIGSFIHDFSSDIDKNYEKYGYVKLGVIDQWLIDWKNEHTSYQEMKKIVDNLNAQGDSRGKKLNPMEPFQIASLGTDLEFSMNKLVNSFDWHQVDLMKQKRAKEYKKKISELLEIDLEETVPYVEKIVA